MLMHCLDRDECSYTIYNDLNLIKTLVSHFQEMLRCLPLGDETERLRVGIAFHEALTNALYHGNLEIGASTDLSDPNSFATLANQRQFQSPYCDRKIHVTISLSRDAVACVVRDEGPGFQPPHLEDQLESLCSENNGRGIVLMRSIMDSVEYNAQGNEVTLVKRKVQPTDESDHTGD